MSGIVLPLILFLFPLAYSPGPGNLFFAALGARAGLSGALPALAGYHLATVVVTGLVGIGLAGVMQQSGTLAQGMRLIGAAYVLWLAWRLARAGQGPDAQGGTAAKLAGFWSGLWLLILNPKAYVIIALMFSQFLTTGSGWMMIVGVTVVFTINNLLAFVLWTVLGEGLARVFAGPVSGQRLNLVFALMLAVVAFWMAWG